MTKKRTLFILFIISISLFTGCWNYVGLDEMTVIAGMAIDKKDEEYLLSFEIYDLQKTTSQDPVKPAIIEATGETIFEAVRNAKKRSANKLYFADAQIIIISEQIAREDGINSILNWFQKDPEIRENLPVVISKEKSAASILKAKGLTNMVISNDIHAIINKDQEITGSSEKIALYEIYNVLNTPGMSLTLPAIHLTENDNQKISELNGIAVFKGDKLIEYLSDEDVKYYLLAKGKLKGSVITFNTNLNANETTMSNISLEIKQCSASRKYLSLDPNNFKIRIGIQMDVVIDEIRDQNKKLDEKDIGKLEKEANNNVKQEVEKVIKKIQKNYNSDILGLGNTLYKTNPRKWNEIEEEFNSQFQNIEIEIKPDIKIINTGFSK